MINGERLKRARIDNGYTQEQLGKKIGVSTASICNYETGKKKPTLRILINLANTLKVKIDYLLNRDIWALSDSDEDYTIMISKEEINIIKELKLNQKIYKQFCINPKRTIKRINNEIDWTN